MNCVCVWSLCREQGIIITKACMLHYLYKLTEDGVCSHWFGESCISGFPCRMRMVQEECHGLGLLTTCLETNARSAREGYAEVRSNGHFSQPTYIYILLMPPL